MCHSKCFDKKFLNSFQCLGITLPCDKHDLRYDKHDMISLYSDSKITKPSLLSLKLRLGGKCFYPQPFEREYKEFAVFRF